MVGAMRARGVTTGPDKRDAAQGVNVAAGTRLGEGTNGSQGSPPLWMKSRARYVISTRFRPELWPGRVKQIFPLAAAREPARARVARHLCSQQARVNIRSVPGRGGPWPARTS